VSGVTGQSLAIETSGLTKVYGSTRAVSDLSLDVRRGEIFGFLGPNGAGKTTTIRLLLALQRPSGGSATVLGLDARRDRLEIHRRVGYLPGELALYPRMTGRQHIDWFGRARGLADLSFAGELARRFDASLDRPIRDLSTGNRQKLGLVLAFMHRPQLLILDEPTSGLDPLMQHAFEQLVREAVSAGSSVFLSSHDLDEVQRLADRVAIVRSGRLIMVDTIDHLRESAPRRIEARFRESVDPAPFAGMAGVEVVGHDGPWISLQVTGPIGPVLAAIAAGSPVDLAARHANLDELFLGLYRDPPTASEGSHSR
jgi:ABC-2 type transport system ATP-binding protein